MKVLLVLLCPLFWLFAQTKITSQEIVLAKKLTVEMTQDEISQLLAQGKVAFINVGINNHVPQEYVALKNKFGVGYVTENCATDPISFQQATTNNQVIGAYLTNLYGTAWLSNLKQKPLGVEIPR